MIDQMALPKLKVWVLKVMPDWSIRDRPSIVSPAKPTHFCSVVPELCWTTTYARCRALALTHEVAGLAELLVGVPPHAIRTRASIALDPKTCLRTAFPPGGLPFPNAKLESRPPGASVPFRADGFALQAFRSPGSRVAAFVSPSRKSFCRTFSGVVWTKAPRSQLRDSSGFVPDSLGALLRS